MKNSKKKQIIQVEDPGGINLKQFYFSVKRNKIRILLFALGGFLIAILYNALVPQKYNVSTSLLVKYDNSQATLNSVHDQIPVDKTGVQVLDQVGVLSSYILNLQTLQNLKWNISWAQKGTFVNTDLYKSDPYHVDTTAGFTQTKNIAVTISPIDDNQYKATCNEVKEIRGTKHKIKFEQTGRFGQPFKNSFFQFTLKKIPNVLTDSDDKFQLTFNDLGLMAKAYQEDLKVLQGDDASDMIMIELNSRQPDRSIDYLNELDKVYIKFGLAEKNKRAGNTVRFINNQIAGIADSLQASGNSVSDFKVNNNVVDINQQSTGIVNDLGKTQGDLATEKMQLDYYLNLKHYITNAQAMKSMVAPSVVGITDASLNALIAKLSSLFNQREVLSYTAEDKSPQMISLDNEISYTQSTISENLNNLISNTRSRVQNIRDQVARINAAKLSIPKTEQNLNKVKRKFDFNNDLYSYLLQKRSEAQIAQASRDPDAQIIDEASFGTANLKGFNHWVNLLIGLVFGAVIPVIYLLLKGFFKNRLEYVEDIRQQLKPNIIGHILHNKFKSEIPVIEYPKSEITESFRNLRINVQYLLKDRECKVISINSAIAGEGKTFVSTNFAALLGISDKTVLLVDADLRQPRTHEILNCSNKVGLSTYLMEKCDYNAVIQPTKINGLSVVTSGPIPDYPSELLANGRLQQFITEAKQHYEYIVFNNSPMNIVKDGMMIVPFSDINIFLLRINKSSINQLEYINQIIQEKMIKNIMVALNNVTAESFTLAENHGHGYYNDDTVLKLN